MCIRDRDTAIARSCNTYFINLGQQLSFDAIRRMSLSMGFGKGYELAPGLTTASGYYPISSDIHSPADLANLSLSLIHIWPLPPCWSTASEAPLPVSQSRHLALATEGKRCCRISPS